MAWKNTHRKTYLPGYNSHVAPAPKHEYQIDLFFMSDLKEDNQQKFEVAMCAIDSFTKFSSIGPLKSKSEADVLAGLMDTSKNLGGKPLAMYADRDGSWGVNMPRNF